MKGWVKLYRKLQDSPIFGDLVLLKLFILCLLKANHKPNKVFLDGINHPIQVAAGQFITGRNRLHYNFYKQRSRSKSALAPQTLWRKLKILQNMEILNIKSTSKFSIITIKNWDIYQNIDSKIDQQTDQQPTNGRPTADQQPTTNKNDKEYIKNEIEKMPVAKPKNDFTAGILHTEDCYDPPSEEWANLLNQIKKNGVH